MGNRRQARELALKILFQVDLVHCNVNEAASFAFQVEDVLPCSDQNSIISFSQELVKGVLSNLPEVTA